MNTHNIDENFGIVVDEILKKNTILVDNNETAVTVFNQQDAVVKTYNVNTKVFNQSLENGFEKIAQPNEAGIILNLFSGL